MGNVAGLIDRVRGEFLEMPDLELTLPQAARLWNLDPEVCRGILDALTQVGFLRVTAWSTVVRTGYDAPLPEGCDAACGESS